MQKALAILALLILSAFGYLAVNHRNYGAKLPPGLPADVPVVDGQVVAGRRTLFEDGKGYVVSIESGLPYDAVVEFYADRVGQGDLTAAPGMGAEFSVGSFRLDGKTILLEIHSMEKTTHVTIAVHLGEWW